MQEQVSHYEHAHEPLYAPVQLHSCVSFARVLSVNEMRAYVKLSSEDKAWIGNYAVTYGTSAAIRHFQTEFPYYLKWTMVNDQKTAMTAKMKQTHSSSKFEPISQNTEGNSWCNEKAKSSICSNKNSISYVILNHCTGMTE